MAHGKSLVMDDLFLRELWCAVLEQAVDDVRSRYHWIHENACLWFTSDRRECPSFLWVCEALDLDPDSIRQRALNSKVRPRKQRTITRMSPFAVWRIEHGLTMRDAAAMLGCHESSIANIETGKLSKTSRYYAAYTALTNTDHGHGHDLRAE